MDLCFVPRVYYSIVLFSHLSIVFSARTVKKTCNIDNKLDTHVRILYRFVYPSQASFFPLCACSYNIPNTKHQRFFFSERTDMSKVQKRSYAVNTMNAQCSYLLLRVMCICVYTYTL